MEQESKPLTNASQLITGNTPSTDIIMNTLMINQFGTLIENIMKGRNKLTIRKFLLLLGVVILQDSRKDIRDFIGSMSKETKETLFQMIKLLKQFLKYVWEMKERISYYNQIYYFKKQPPLLEYDYSISPISDELYITKLNTFTIDYNNPKIQIINTIIRIIEEQIEKNMSNYTMKKMTTLHDRLTEYELSNIYFSHPLLGKVYIPQRWSLSYDGGWVSLNEITTDTSPIIIGNFNPDTILPQHIKNITTSNTVNLPAGICSTVEYLANLEHCLINQGYILSENMSSCLNELKKESFLTGDVLNSPVKPETLYSKPPSFKHLIVSNSWNTSRNQVHVGLFVEEIQKIINIINRNLRKTHEHKLDEKGLKDYTKNVFIDETALYPNLITKSLMYYFLENKNYTFRKLENNLIRYIKHDINCNLKTIEKIIMETVKNGSYTVGISNLSKYLYIELFTGFPNIRYVYHVTITDILLNKMNVIYSMLKDNSIPHFNIFDIDSGRFNWYYEINEQIKGLNESEAGEMIKFRDISVVILNLYHLVLNHFKNILNQLLEMKQRNRGCRVFYNFDVVYSKDYNDTLEKNNKTPSKIIHYITRKNPIDWNINTLAKLESVIMKLIIPSDNSNIKTIKDVTETVFEFLNQQKTRFERSDSLLTPIKNKNTIYTIRIQTNLETEIINPKYKEFKEKQKKLEDLMADEKMDGKARAEIAQTYTALEPPPEKIKEIVSDNNVQIEKINEFCKPLNTLYLRERDTETLVNTLENYKQNDIFEKFGIPKKLGIMAHGLPGTGKTSTIKAIATFLNIDIYYVRLNEIKTNRELKCIFDKISKENIKKGMVVFEDIDAMTDIVKRREYRIDCDDSEDSEETEHSVSSVLAKNDEKLTFEYLLNMLDGTLCNENNIFVITTNHKECLDPALYRTGRIDIDIEFKLCDHYQIRQIMHSIMGFSLESLTPELISMIPEDVYTPATIIFHCTKYYFKRTDMKPETLIELLLNQ